MTRHTTLPLALSIADIPVKLWLHNLDEPVRSRILDRYAAFVAVAPPTAISIDVHVEPGAEYIPFGSTPSWQIKSSVQAGRLEFESHREKGWVDLSLGRGALALRPKGDPALTIRQAAAP